LNRGALALPTLLTTSLLLVVAAAAAQAKTINVNALDDPSGAGGCLSGGQCSLRQAVGAASTGDVIALGSGTYSLTQGTNIVVANSLVFEGAGVGSTTIDGSENINGNSAQVRILKVATGGAAVTIENLTFTGGDDGADENCCSGPTFNLNGGGAIFNQSGDLTLQNLAFADNTGSILGGAVSNSGTLQMHNVSFTSDEAVFGGGLFSRGNVTAAGVTFENDATGATDQAAVYLLSGTAGFTNTTVVGSGGASSRGGGIHNSGATLTLTSDTLSNNIRGSLQTDQGASTSVANTIIGNGFSDGDGDCVASGLANGNGGSTATAITHDLGNNLDQDNSCNLTAEGDVPNVDPMLGPIADNGGPTRTEALQVGSPAIDAGNPATCPPTDQRGVTRDSKCDIGAYEYVAPQTGTGDPPPSAPPGSPALSTAPPSLPTASAPAVGITGASFAGSVDPNGLATQVTFEYGLDSRYRAAGTSGPVYDQSTAPQSIGADFSSHAIGPIPVTDLIPNAIYHVRLVATNSLGTAFSPDVAFTTAKSSPPGSPTLGRTFNVSVVKGLVLIKINGKFVPLTELRQIPAGSQIDARHGSLELFTATSAKGKLQHGTFGGAIFKLTQARSGLTTLSLVEDAFKGAPSYSACKAHKAGEASAAALSSNTLQLLHASAHGKFRTSGRYSAATVRGTIWTVADRCDGTLTRDITDSVLVNDFVRHKTIILRAGQSYLARARP
jgi:hypothetical protein